MTDSHESFRKPRGVPVEAVFVGGSDGGIFIRLLRRNSKPPFLYGAAVFDDFTGECLFKGFLQQSPVESMPVDALHAEEVAGWSSNTLYFLDGRELRHTIPTGVS